VKKRRRQRSPEDISTDSRRLIFQKLEDSERFIGGAKPPVEIADVFQVPADLVSTFNEELSAVDGILIQGKNEQELIDKLKQFMEVEGLKYLHCTDEFLQGELSNQIHLTTNEESFETMEAGITRCELLVARSGSIVVSARTSGRRMNVFPPVHIVWADKNQLVPFVGDAIESLKQKYGSIFPSQVTFITGPSRTADIEKTLVKGVHGPQKVVVLLNLQV
jgi:L-lactate dehydrogenase complex protein LldG